MSGNPNHRPASVHPFHHSLAITDIPRPGRVEAREEQDVEAREEQNGRPEGGGRVPAPQAQAPQEMLAAELADFLWKRQDPGPGRPPSSSSVRGSAQDSGMWRDKLLAEIEELAETLKEKVNRYSLLQAAQSSVHAGEPSNETAVAWIQDALEDIAATALGIEIASRELFLRAGSAGTQVREIGLAPEQRAGTAE